MAHESLLTYSVSRSYPYKWITPLVTVGGVIIIVLFSYLNYVSSGFYLSLRYVENPNATMRDANWMNRWPSYFIGQSKPKCQPQELQINSAFSTNQSSLMYNLRSVWTLEDERRVLQPGLTYLNNPLQNCEVQNIHIHFEAEDRSATQYGWNTWGLKTQAFILCAIRVDGRYTFFNLTSDYDFVPSTARFPTGDYETQVGAFSFLTRNATTKGSLWWGESLMSHYWSYASKLMQDTRNATSNNLRKGTIHFLRNERQDIRDPDFWTVDSRFLSNTYWGRTGAVTYALGGRPSELAAGKDSNIMDLRNIWLPADGLAKSIFSTILVDLGQPFARPNILADADTLQFFTKNFTEMMRTKANAQPGPAQDSFEALKDEIGPLEITPSVISAKYLCEVPQRKSMGTLFISIFIADLVLVQAVWKLFSLCASSWHTSRHPEANYCAGCTRFASDPGFSPISPIAKKGLYLQVNTLSHR